MYVNLTSEVWLHFNHIKTEEASCKRCNTIISFKGSSTSGFINHLKLHDIHIAKKEEKTLVLNEQKVTMYDFMNNNNTLPGILASCATHDGMFVHSIINSTAVQSYILSKGFQIRRTCRH